MKCAPPDCQQEDGIDTLDCHEEQFVSPDFMPCRSFRGTIYVCQMV